MSQEEMKIKRTELAEARRKMAVSCQSSSMKAWRRYGKQVVKLSRELGVFIPAWMEKAFGRSM